MYGLIAGFCVIFASVAGSLSALIFPRITHRANDTILGFAAGVMLSAAFLGLLPSAFLSTAPEHVFLGLLGVLIGAVFISLLDRFVPHIHFESAIADAPGDKGRHSRLLLLVVAIAIHNIPEGLATGIAFSGGLTPNAYLVALSMVIQKVPEGLIIAVPLLSMGLKKPRALLVSVLVSLMMLPGLLVGIFLGTLPLSLVSFFYAFTFGAIVYVVSDEIIPESHEHGFQRSATFALIAGILVVMLLEMLL